MVRQAQSLLRVVLFGVCDGERGHLLRGLERPHVDGVRGKLRRLPERAEVLAIIRPVVRGDHRAQGRQGQHRQSCENNLLVTLHRSVSPPEIVLWRCAL